jgi:hypothetical protein
MANTQIHKNSSVQHLLGNFSDLPLKDIEYFIQELNALVVRKRNKDAEKRDKFLLRKINESVLSDAFMQQYTTLQEKMELETLSDLEHKELLQLVEKEEKIRNKRFQYLIELAQLRAISLGELMQKLGLNTVGYA